MTNARRPLFKSWFNARWIRAPCAGSNSPAENSGAASLEVAEDGQHCVAGVLAVGYVVGGAEQPVPGHATVYQLLGRQVGVAAAT